MLLFNLGTIAVFISASFSYCIIYIYIYLHTIYLHLVIISKVTYKWGQQKQSIVVLKQQKQIQN